MNVLQWEMTPMSAATRKECNECARRDYVSSLTKQLVTDLGLKEESNDDDQSQDS